MFLNRYKYYITGLLLAYILAAVIIHITNDVLTQKLKTKTWVHRVNSIEKQKEVIDLFGGIELDVVFLKDKLTFDVNHPPAESIDLSLYTYLAAIEKKENKRLWIDYKNLTSQNALESLIRLDSICTLLAFRKDQFIIESMDPSNLSIFQKSGYKTAYYLPYNVSGLTTTDKNRVVKTIRNNVEQNYTDYISMDLGTYQTMSTELPDKEKLLWSFYYQESFAMDPRKLAKKIRRIQLKHQIKSDNSVLVMLYGYATAYDR